jgi:putative MATE family efflux protein
MSEELTNRTDRLGVFPVGKLLLEFSIPAIIAMIANALYNVVDSIFVGRGVGPLALTAVTIAFPIMIILMAFGMLIGIGATALISLKLGQQRRDEAEQILGTAFAMTIILGVGISAVVLVFLDPILRFLGATPDVFGYAKQFSTVILIGSTFQFISFGLNNIIRAEGFPRISMATMLFSAGVNTILNPFFIFVLHWGVIGSAMATVSTQVMVSAFIIYHFTIGRSNLKLHRKYIKVEIGLLGKITAIGLSPFLLQLAASVVLFIFNNNLLQYGGEMAVAAMGVINRTAMMLLMHRVTGVDVKPSWALLFPLVAASGVLSAAFGLTLGTRVQPRFSGLLFAVVLGPLMLFGCAYYPWASLNVLGSRRAPRRARRAARDS